MREDPEVRELRDRVRNLEGQLASARGRSTGPMGCVIAAIAVLGVVIVGAGAAGFLIFSTRGRSASVQADSAATELAQAQSAEEIARLRAQVDELQAQAAAGGASADPQSSYVDDDAVYDGRVTATTGASHVHVGDTCRVDLAWTTDPSRYCRALVDCGARHVYGDVGQGWLPCQATADGLTTGEDPTPSSEDGDPRISIDRGQSLVQISDEGPAWTITLSISAHSEEEGDSADPTTL